MYNESVETNPWLDMVHEFHEKMGCTIGNSMAIRDVELRCSLIQEECNETLKAIREGNLKEAIDGICDTIYVLLGTAVAFGVPLAPFFREVHRSNMEKLDGPVRADGKKLKPEGWKPPDIQGLIEKLSISDK
jgi:predicted HAD superfamily Cof-like phosphohydrolase